MSKIKQQQARESWAEEVIAAALEKTTISHIDGASIDDNSDEGIASDESSPSSSSSSASNSSAKEPAFQARSSVRRAQQLKSKSTMVLNESYLSAVSEPSGNRGHSGFSGQNRKASADTHNNNHHQTGNIVRFLRSLVLSKSSQAKKQNRVFGKDLRLHLQETKQEGKSG